MPRSLNRQLFFTKASDAAEAILDKLYRSITTTRHRPTLIQNILTPENIAILAADPVARLKLGDVFHHIISNSYNFSLPEALLFLDSGAMDLNAGDSEGSSLVMKAVNGAIANTNNTGQDYLTLLQRLLQDGAPVDVINQRGFTTLTSAVYTNNVPLVRLLLQYGAQPDRSDMENAMARAEIQNVVPLVKLLMEHGAPRDERMIDFTTRRHPQFVPTLTRLITTYNEMLEKRAAMLNARMEKTMPSIDIAKFMFKSLKKKKKSLRKKSLRKKSLKKKKKSLKKKK